MSAAFDRFKKFDDGPAALEASIPHDTALYRQRQHVIAIDDVPERLAMAQSYGKAETIDFSQEDVYERLQEMTNGRGADAGIDAVGAEAHGSNRGALLAESIELRTTGHMCSCKWSSLFAKPGNFVCPVSTLARPPFRWLLS